MPIKTVYEELATIINAIERNETTLEHIETRLETVTSESDLRPNMIDSLTESRKHTEECIESHIERLEFLVEEAGLLPSGSGFDCGTRIDIDNSTSNKLIFFTEYHHMDEDGMYCGWSQWNVTITPSLALGIVITVDMVGETVDDYAKDFVLFDFEDFVGEEFELCLTKKFDTHDDRYLPKHMKRSA